MADEPRRVVSVLPRIRRRLRIGVGGLMVVILLIGLWLGDRVGRARKQRLAVEAVEAAGGLVHYTDEFIIRPVPAPPNVALWKPEWGGLVAGLAPWQPNWLLRHLGLGAEYSREVAYVQLFGFVRQDRDRPIDGLLRALKGQSGLRALKLGGGMVTDAGLAAVANLAQLREFILQWGTGITDAGLAPLGRLPRLNAVIIGHSSLTDESLRHLARLPELEYLDLQGRRFTDRGLEHLARARRLRVLFLEGEESEIGDAGLRHLEALPNLRYLYLPGAKLSNGARAQLHRARPGLEFSPWRLP